MELPGHSLLSLSSCLTRWPADCLYVFPLQDVGVMHQELRAWRGPSGDAPVEALQALLVAGHTLEARKIARVLRRLPCAHALQCLEVRLGIRQLHPGSAMPRCALWCSSGVSRQHRLPCSLPCGLPNKTAQASSYHRAGPTGLLKAFSCGLYSSCLAP